MASQTWSDPTGPAEHAFAVTPSDTALARQPRALYVGTGGTVVCRLWHDSADVTFSNVPDGTVLPISPKYVRAASTASNILALY